MKPIGIDLDGGDAGRNVIIAGIRQYARANDDHVPLILYGSDLNDLVGAYDKLVLCDRPLSKESTPIEIVRDRKTAIARGIAGIAADELSAFVSAGNTTALVLQATRILKPISPYSATLPATLPNRNGPCILLDAGARSSCTTEDLLRYVHLGASFLAVLDNRRQPRIGLLNIGAERTKGDDFLRAAYPLLHDEVSRLGYVFEGNVEPDRLFSTLANIVVTPGLLGNVALKAAEGAVNELYIRLGVVGKTIRWMRSQFSHSAVGGAPILGLNGIVVKAHGKSDPVAITNAIRTAKKMVESDMLPNFRRSLLAVV